MRSTLRLEHAGKTLMFLDRQTIVPLRVAMQGVRFRIPLTREEVDRGVLCITPAFDCFRCQGMAHEHEPANQRRQQDIERQNQELANVLCAMLEAARNEQLFAHPAIPTAYARLSDPRGYPV